MHRTLTHLGIRVRTVALVALVAVLGTATVGCSSSSSTSSSTSSPAQLAISGGSGSTFQDGQVVSVSFGPNSKFTPNIRINIIMCSDPGGSSANLPTSYIDCDGNTIQGDTVTVQKDGSFTEHNYTMFRLPSVALGESKSAVPVCNQNNPCVLMASQYQTDLSKPRAFSAAFTVSGTGLGKPS